MNILVDDLEAIKKDIEKNIELDPKNQLLKGLMMGYSNSLSKAKRLLKLERDQIIDFGIRSGMYAAKRPNQLITDGIEELKAMYNEMYK